MFPLDIRGEIYHINYSHGAILYSEERTIVARGILTISGCDGQTDRRIYYS